MNISITAQQSAKTLQEHGYNAKKKTKHPEIKKEADKHASTKWQNKVKKHSKKNTSKNKSKKTP